MLQVPLSAWSPMVEWRTAARMIIDLNPAPRRLRLTERTELTVGKGLADLEVEAAVPEIASNS